MQCQICKKSGMTGNNVSHSKRRTKTRWMANVHKQTLVIDGKTTRVKICRQQFVSHSKRRTKTRWMANVHKQTLVIDGKTTRVKICSRCLRTMYKLPRGKKARARAVE